MERYSRIPEALKEYNDWVVCQISSRNGKPTKIPINPGTGFAANVADPETWGSFAEAMRALERFGVDDIGFVLSSQSPFFGVDIDRLLDLSDEAFEAVVKEVDRLGTYLEWSHSGAGFHCIGKGKLPPGGRRKGHYEMYDEGRFFVMTGDWLDFTPPTIQDVQQEIEDLHLRIFGKTPDPLPTRFADQTSTAHLPDGEIIQRAAQAKNGWKFLRLWEGDWQGLYHSQSEADLALSALLSFWVNGDPERIDRLFRQSGLYRQKWERADYRNRTIGRVIS